VTESAEPVCAWWTNHSADRQLKVINVGRWGAVCNDSCDQSNAIWTGGDTRVTREAINIAICQLDRLSIASSRDLGQVCLADTRAFGEVMRVQVRPVPRFKTDADLVVERFKERNFALFVPLTEPIAKISKHVGS
jgi:hypothetical protein